MAAAAAATEPPSKTAKRIVLATWESGGPAPLMSNVAVYEDGTVVFHGEDTQDHRARLGGSDLARLRGDLASPAFAAALARLGGDSVLHRSDAETVSFFVGTRPEAGYEMCSDEPADPAVANLVRELNAAGDALFGKLFNHLPLPSPCPENHGPWDMPKKPSPIPPAEPLPPSELPPVRSSSGLGMIQKNGQAP